MVYLWYRCAWMRGTSNSTELGIGVMEAQWKAYVDKLRESGELSSAMAICDVSGSMRGQPMEVSALILPRHSQPDLYKKQCNRFQP